MPTKNNFKKMFFCILLIEGTFTSFFKGKKSKRSHKTEEIKFLFYYFRLIIEGSGSGSIPLTNGSGSRRTKNTWIRCLYYPKIRDPGWVKKLRSGMGKKKDPDPG
jgi:hypothetical protein